MKLIIDIPEDMFEWFKNGEIIDEYDKSALKQVFKYGIPLDDVKSELANINTFERAGCWVMKDVFKVLDIIGKAESED